MNTFDHKTESNKSLQRGDIAIIGMACIFPGAPNLRTYWENILSKVNAITDPPEDWEADLFYDPDSQANDRIYCKRGGYLGNLARFNPFDYGIMPLSIDGGEPDHYLALRLAYDALTDAGYENRIDSSRTEVIIGRGTYINRGWATLAQHGLIVDQTLMILQRLCPEYSQEKLKVIKQELKDSLPPFNAETCSGLIPNIITGRIANRLNIMGTNYIIDAACASSLIAVDHGMQDLLTHKCDMALVGGVQASTPAPLLMIFCQLNALSRGSEIRPFDKNADGTLLGEGAGIIVLKRREDAESDGDRIYALIKGVGTSSDGRGVGLLTPRVEGEELALRKAYEIAGISPQTIELIEAHGTGTPVGDLTEIQALKLVFGPRSGNLPWCGLGSVKSMISHLIPAAGIAALIKVALSLYYKVLPPTLNCDEPDPKFELEKTPFYINTETRPWIHGSQEIPRRAGVNAFGFGGINAHAILEEYNAGNGVEAINYHCYWDTEVFILQGDSREALIKQGQELHDYLFKGPNIELKDLAYTLNTALGETPYRLAIVASSLQELEKKLAYALNRLADSQCMMIKAKEGIYFFEEPLKRDGKLAFIFPGEGSQYVNMLSDLCIHFPEVRAYFDRIDRAFINHKNEYLPSQLIFPPPAVKPDRDGGVIQDKLWQIEGAVSAVITANQALFALLSRIEIRPQAILGHSTGEYTALQACGIMDLSDEHLYEQYVAELHDIYQRVSIKDEIPHANLVAVGADSAKVAEIINQIEGELYLAMDNCPHQSVIVGTEAEVQKLIVELNRQGLIYEILPFDRPYHTPLFEAYAENLKLFFSRWLVSYPSTPIYSCCTAAPFSTTLEEICNIAAEHWVRPVKFRKTIERMYADGVRIFVEVGPRGNLTSFVDDILRDREYMAVAANVATRSGINQLNHMVGILAAQGVSMQLDYLYTRRAPEKLSLDVAVDSTDKENDIAGSMRLSLGLPRLQLGPDSLSWTRGESTSAGDQHKIDQASQPLTVESPPPLPQDAQIQAVHYSPDSRSQVMQEHIQTMERFLEVQQEVMHTFMTGSGAVDSLASKIALTTSKTPGVIGSSQDLDYMPNHSLGAAVPHSVQPSILAHPSGEDILDSMDEAPAVFTRDGEHGSLPDDETTPEAIEEMLLTLISEKTGYPTEMLNITLNLESDLGIDSIKRIEILGALREKNPNLVAEDIEKVAALKTLQQMIDFLSKRSGGEHSPAPTPTVQPSESTIADVVSSSQMIPPMAFISEIVSLTPGKELVALRQINLDKDIYLQHHTLGGQVSIIDKGLTALPVMPLTMSMEILAEAGALLMPDKVLIGMKDIRAYRWITLDENSVTLQIVARRSPTANYEVEVEIHNLEENTTVSDNTVLKGTMIFAATYPQPPVVEGSFSLCNERTSRWSLEQLYTEAMFHGPCWQGVSSIDRWGEDGSIATLKVLPTDQFFRSKQNPEFVIDPIVLDAAGQVVGFWTMEHLERGFLVFPYRVKNLHIYRSRLPEHQKVRCHARIKLVGAQQVSSDIDMIGEDGQPWMRLEAWEDKRFDLPSTTYAFLLSPVKAMPSIPWNTPLDSFPDADSFFCRRSKTLFHGDEGFWKRVIAHLILNHNERQVFSDLGKSEKRQTQWLMGRLVAKDAVRMFLKQRYEMELGPVDVEIAQDEYGCPVPRGAWSKEIESVPALSLAHTKGIDVAIAGHQHAGQKVGIDVEEIRSLEQEFETTAFAPKEIELLDSVTESARQQWVIRLWSAKEAAAKALGRGLTDGPQSLAVQALDAETGIVKITLKGKLAERFPDLARTAMIVYTGREEKHIFASTICERN